MRRMILTTLVLLPVLAQAEARTSTEPKPSPSSAMFQAEPTRPAGIAGNLVGAALHQGGTVEYAMMGDVPVAPSVPQVSRAVEVDLSAQELADQPAVSSVVLRATVDAYGYPRNVTVVHSANAVLDKKVLAAVGQFRFTPATLDNKAVDAPVTITIKIEKK